MGALIGTYEDEWAKAVTDPDVRKQFRQFANTVSSVALSICPTLCHSLLISSRHSLWYSLIFCATTFGDYRHHAFIDSYRTKPDHKQRLLWNGASTDPPIGPKAFRARSSRQTTSQHHQSSGTG